MMMNTRTLVAICSFSLLLPLLFGTFAGSAAADEVGERGLVLESYVGPRPRDADHLVGPLLDELKKAGFRGSSVVGSRIQARHSITPEKLSKKDIQKIRQLILDGELAYSTSRFEGAIDFAGKGLALLLQRPATMATQQQVRDLMYGALITLSMAHHRLGNTDKLREVMGEYIRSFPDKEVSRRDYGPEGAEIYRKVIREMNEHKRGELQIAAGAGATIFINERYVGLGSFNIKLFPGQYRVYTQKGAKAGRVHLVTVEEGGKTPLIVDELLDKTLHTSDSFVGFSFSDEESQTQNERRMAIALGKALGTKTIILVGLHTKDGRSHVVASAISTESEDHSGDSAQILVPSNGAPSAQRLRELAQYVAGAGPASASIEVLNTSRTAGSGKGKAGRVSIGASKGSSAPDNSGLCPIWRYGSWVTGLGAMAAGGYFIS
ncbi:MAG: hypothetical protein JKY56_04945, partial [Kofleriaceae bacterium]|nr:hypothetical protein [Kofleriaceae bacterium]